MDQGVTGLTTTLSQSETAAFTAQLATHEALATPPCTRTVTTDHQAGAEAVRVTVTVSQQCTAIAYDAAVLPGRANQEPAHRGGTHPRIDGAGHGGVPPAATLRPKRAVA